MLFKRTKVNKSKACDCGMSPAQKKRIKFADIHRAGPRFVNMSGKNLGNMIVLGPQKRRLISSSKVWYWGIQCGCGAIVAKQGKLLRRYRAKDESQFCCVRCPRYRSKALGVAAENFFIRKVISKAKGEEGSRRRRRNIRVHLTKAEILSLSRMDCYYCGAEPSNHYGNAAKRDGIKFNTIDRRNSSKGYSTSNCVPACWTCNNMKKELSVKTFRKQVKRILCHRGWA